MSYCTPDDVRNRGGLSDPPYSDAIVQAWIDWAEKFIEEVTGQWFTPRTMTVKLDGRDTRTQLVSVPIISISKVEFVDFPTIPSGVSEVDLDAFVVYNRHVADGLLNPDDRANPRIAFQGTKIGRRQIFIEEFPEGKQNVWLTGLFGYTEPNPNAGRSIATNAGDAITAPDEIKMVNGAFTQEDVGRAFTIAGSASNDGAYKIVEVVSSTEVKVEEQTLTTEGNGFTASVSAFPQWGVVPELIKDVCIRLVLREMPDPTAGSSGAPDGYQYEARMRAAGRVTQEKVRDQSISYAPPGGAGEGNLSGVITGDPFIDMILLKYRRPPKFTSV